MRRATFLARCLRRSLLATAGCLALGPLAASCGGGVETDCQGQGQTSSSIIFDKLTSSRIDKLDIVLAVDNSRSMADKQQILSLAVPDLVKGLVNPGCVNPATGDVETTPVGPLDKCPAGTQRKFDPLLDVHIGVISSSLGGHGSDACATDGTGKASNNDKGHLLARLDPTKAAEAETYQNLKFLAWDPAQMLTPPGEADVDADSAADPNDTALVPSLSDIVRGAGEVGCGYESQLESWYRFLVDPSPPEDVTLDAAGKVVLQGTDNVLLEQRKAFLRPDSLLAIIMLTDEDDCSIRESGQFYFAAQQKSTNGSPFHLPKARAICDTSPSDQCCFSCGQTGPKDDSGNPLCDADPSCKDGQGKTVYLDDVSDNINLRCYDQKRRFGIDFLYDTDRYVNALRSPTVTDRNGSVVQNPIFSDLDQSDNNSNTRTSNMIFLAGIVGVPWQDIARTDANGVPDLKAGLDPSNKPRGGFKNADEMVQPLPGKDYNTWDVVLGALVSYPSADALPKDPHMIESVDARAGANPITGDVLAPPTQPLADKINGNEYTIPKRDDLQYACTFPLVKVDANGDIAPDVRDCSAGGLAACDCEDPMNDNPLCEVNPSSGAPTNQVRAKAYPGLRELQVLKDIGSQGIVASVCPAQLTAPGDPDFGYRAAIGAIVDRLQPATSAQCLQPALAADAGGSVSCLILEAKTITDSQANACNQCAAAGRAPVSEAHAGAVTALKEDNPTAKFNCFCEVPQLANEKAGVTGAECQKSFDQAGFDLCACQYTDPKLPVTAGGKDVDGWCYVDETAGIGNPAIVDSCPDSEKRIIRFVGAGAAQPGATLFIACELDHKVGDGTTCGSSAP